MILTTDQSKDGKHEPQIKKELGGKSHTVARALGSRQQNSGFKPWSV